MASLPIPKVQDRYRVHESQIKAPIDALKIKTNVCVYCLIHG